MSRLLLRFRALSGELKRRKVVRVLIAYLVASTAIVGVVADAGPALGMPEHGLTIIIVLLLLGLPVALLLAWMYELVPDPGQAADASRHDNDAVAPELEREVAGGGNPDAGGGRHPDALPVPGTPFIGRDAELEELARLIADDGCRLVTVLGPGGVGKTRLALQAAEAAAVRFRDGVVFVQLTGLPAPALLPQALAEALDITLSRRAEPLAELLDFLREKQLLLVLDNFDQLTPAARMVDAILHAAPGVHLVVTSRERLNLAAESLLPLAGLTLERPARQRDSDALRLFVTAARRHDPHFELDAESRPCAERLCELLAGIPLAMELAAAWTRLLSCGEILQEVRRDLDILSSDSPAAPERHRSLGATFEASWRLLGERERAALARLAVFMAPFDRAAAAAVADADLPLLRVLVDKSFIEPAHGHFHMLHVVRQYALKRLDVEEERATRSRHLSWFADWLHALEPHLMRAEPAAVTSVAQAIAEIRAAWVFACQTRAAAAIGRATDGLFHFYEARGWSREGVDAFASAAKALAGGAPADDEAVLSARGRLDVRRGALLERLGELKQAERLLRDGLRTAERLHDTAEVAFALHSLGKARWVAGAYEEAAAHHARARELYERMGNRHGIGWSLAHLGNVALTTGEHDLAGELYTEGLRILRAENDRNGMCVTLNNLGYIAIRRKQYSEARHSLGEALALQAVLGNHRSAAYLLNNLGFAAREAGDYTEAAQHFNEALALSERFGYRGIAAASLTGLAELHVRTHELAAAVPLLARALDTAKAIGDHRVALEALLTVARLREHGGDSAGACRIAAFVAAHTATPADAAAEAAALLDRQPDCGPDPEPPHDDVQRMIDEVLADDPAPQRQHGGEPPHRTAQGRVGASIQPR